MLSVIYTSNTLVVAIPVYAEFIPGGAITNPAIRAVDVAKPAVVRIITTMGGQLSVFFPNNTTALFPQNGGLYQIQASGTGAFISAHGDILTADHVINPPHDTSLNQFLDQEAAQEIADYVNVNLHPPVPWKSQDALNALNSGYFLSQPHYDAPASKVYLSTDYTGPLQAATLQDLPASIATDVDNVEIDSPFDQKDLAIIHVNMDNTPSIPLDDSSNVAQQDELTIIGFPGNGDVSTKHDPTDMLTSSVNKLLVSALKYTDNGTHVIQTGGNIEHGDSGGPALNSSGHIVGVVSFDQNTDVPEGTGFLQTSNNATSLINTLGLDLTPGNLQQQWMQAFTDYASTAPGHWHKALADFQHLATTYPQFQAVAPFLTYSQNQASKEQLQTKKSSQTHPNLLVGIVAICVAVLFMTIVLVLAVSASRRKRRPLPASHGNGENIMPFIP
jgi:S1-C subfamily serine protease